MKLWMQRPYETAALRQAMSCEHDQRSLLSPKSVEKKVSIPASEADPKEPWAPRLTKATDQESRISNHRILTFCWKDYVCFVYGTDNIFLGRRK